MQDLIPFDFQGNALRVILVGGDPWFALADVCTALDLSNPSQVASRLDEDALITNEVIDSMGRPQSARFVSEPGLYEVIATSRSPKAKPFKRWLFSEVLPSIRKTGSYGKPSLDLTSLDSISALLDAGKAALNRAIEAEARAKVSEERLDVIEGGKGFALREFHKHYFPDVPERQFFELLYKRHLLIDQRGARGRDANGKLKNGKQHKHPGYAGKPYFFLDPYIDRFGDWFYNTRVRPGRPETELVKLLEKWGLPSNQHKLPEIAA
ncbi:hypothetical protein FYJ24_07070 [Actinomycetaceae bacterium WB03_NA08]|uniref:Bro-N domain-containing protein n=1 Tax=Scrofimicrobium canadense TaxID=2652290 RepID=A0A6N7VRX4_9ACTO|nr:Bro-N domain-containing protein [Scrofimicrobium canadense]MSS84529.1 hypothetical protein [Scrofimicrobium canadense]